MRTLVLFIPIGILGIIRWSSWLIRRVPAVLYRPYPEGHAEPITVVTPVYQEDPEVFLAAVESWLANPGVHEVIAVVDETDTTCIELAKQLSLVKPVTLIVTDVPGKRDALRRGWEAATTEIVALVDSDTVWADDVAVRVVEPFVDPEVGGVGTRQNVLNPESLWQRLNDFYLDSRYFDEVAGQAQWGQAVSCLSGRTAVYRRSLLLEISHEFMTETFMGVPCNSGEDKRLTMLTLRRGYKTWMQQNARVWSTFPVGMRVFFRQRLRWARNTWRSDLRALKEGWVFRHKWLAFSMLDKAVSSFTLLVAPVFLVYALVTTHFAVAGLLVLWWLVSRGVKYLPHFQRRPSDVLLLPAFIVVTFVVAALKILALGSIRRQRWLTRDVAVVDGKIVRVAGGGAAPKMMPGAAPRMMPGAASGAVLGTARRRWLVPAAMVAGVALVGTSAGLAQAQLSSRPSAEQTPPFAEIALGSGAKEQAPAPPPPAALPSANAVLPGPASQVIETVVAACPEPDAAPVRSGDNPLYSGAGPDRTLSAYAPFRILKTGCRFPEGYRAMLLQTDQIRLHAGGSLVRTVPWPVGATYTLPTLAAAVNDGRWIEQTDAGVFEVRAAMVQDPSTVLRVAGPEVQEVRLVDNPHVFLGGRRATASFDGVRVRSWSATEARVEDDYRDGRPFVLYEDGSTFDINESVFDHLGSDRAQAYGVSWRTGGTTGTITESTFSANFFGMYSYEAVGLTFRDNEFVDNVFYGVDPHDRSHGLLFENNVFQGNGSHGAIVSQGVFDTVFRGNRSISNGGNGFVVDAGSHDVVLEENEASDNAIDGIVLLHAGENRVTNNTVRDNRVGIRINGEGASGNRLEGNTVESNVNGIQIYGGANTATVNGEVVRRSEQIGVMVDAPSTLLLNVDVAGGRIGVDLRSPSSIRGGAISDVEVGVAVRSRERVAIDGVRITAEEIGVRVDRRSSASLSGTTVVAPQPYKGSEQIVRGADVEVRTLAAPGLHWFGVFGFAFLVLGLTLEAIRRLRNRGRSLGGSPPEIVRSNFA